MRPLNFAWGGVSLITTRLSVMVLQVMLKGDDTVTIIYSVCLSAPLLVLCFSFVAGRQVLIRGSAVHVAQCLWPCIIRPRGSF